MGVTCSNAVQGVVAATRLGAVIVRVQPLFEAIKWAGIAYLVFLAIQALKSAASGRYLPFGEEKNRPSAGGCRQGFLSNITNPKVLGAWVQPRRAFPALPSAPGHRSSESTLPPHSPGASRIRCRDWRRPFSALAPSSRWTASRGPADLGPLRARTENDPLAVVRTRTDYRAACGLCHYCFNRGAGPRSQPGGRHATGARRVSVG